MGGLILPPIVEKDFDLVKEQIQFVPLWIHIPLLLIELWNVLVLKHIISPSVILLEWIIKRKFQKVYLLGFALKLMFQNH